jgi:hypothetical protein
METEKKTNNAIEKNIQTSKNGFFHQTKLENAGATQTTTVTVNVNPPQENCLSALFSCFKRNP